ncbi:hypothetical protein EVAR_72359_1 [Eumeta japonica]|uniref:Uncharacterized protein n=1 Tax=Eumeta variegata TaxID=151549 RepID=A0A4C1SKJ8_EUMVA|nr:hypothetical protein EVAR_72359_1 [Eumeta japonica]
MDFVAAYIGEQVGRLNDLRNDDGDILRGIIVDELPAVERLRQLADVITTNLLSPRAVPLLEGVTVDSVVSTFRNIQSQITGVVIRPDFENVYSAVHNYYINRIAIYPNRIGNYQFRNTLT